MRNTGRTPGCSSTWAMAFRSNTLALGLPGAPAEACQTAGWPLPLCRAPASVQQGPGPWASLLPGPAQGSKVPLVPSVPHPPHPGCLSSGQILLRAWAPAPGALSTARPPGRHQAASHSPDWVLGPLGPWGPPNSRRHSCISASPPLSLPSLGPQPTLPLTLSRTHGHSHSSGASSPRMDGGLKEGWKEGIPSMPRAPTAWSTLDAWACCGFGRCPWRDAQGRGLA